jgi:hypothetical protein
VEIRLLQFYSIKSLRTVASISRTPPYPLTPLQLPYLKNIISCRVYETILSKN